MSIFIWKMEEDRLFNEWAKETFGGRNVSKDSIALIERRHRCIECHGPVSYVRKPKTMDEYQFVCRECGHTAEDMPLRR